MNPKQKLFVTYYTEGETKGNCEQSMLKAGYKEGYARKWSGVFIGAIRGIKEAVDNRLKEIIECQEITIEVLNKEFKRVYDMCLEANDRTNAVRILENWGKHTGYNELDNIQKVQERKLDERQQAEANRLANLRLMDTG
jgi:phage terminase small subunit